MPLNNKSEEIHKRAFSTMFTRAEGTGRTVEGYAAVFNSKTNLWGRYYEVIETGAFDEALKNSDCRALFNHNPNHLLARTSSNTLALSVDEKGLRYSFESPNTGCGNDILEMIARGDLKESSFAFTIEDYEWIEEKDGEEVTYTMKIKKVRMLYDVAPVTYPAYPDTTVGKRSLDEYLAQKTPAGLDHETLAALYGSK